MEPLIVIAVGGAIIFFTFRWVAAAWRRGQSSQTPTAPMPREQQTGAAYVKRNLSHLPESSNAGRPEGPSVYLHSDRWDELLVADTDGMPTLYLAVVDGRLRLTEPTTGLFVSVGNKKLRPMGLWTVNVRGINHHKAAVRTGDFRPGSRLQLVREPENAYDKNAVAVHALGSDKLAGYVNKGMAPGLAKLLDAGTELEAIALHGDGKGKSGPIHVLIASAPLMAHML